MSLLTSKVDALKIIDTGTGDAFVGDKTLFTAAQIGNGNFIFDPKTGHVWSSDGSTFTDITQALTAGTVTNSTLRWNGSAWVENTNVTATSAGAVTAAQGFTATAGGVTATAGNIVATAGNINATAGSMSAGTTVTAGTGVTATTGNIAASSGNVSASGTVTAGTGVIATTGGVTATAGGLTATAGGLSVVAGTSALSGGTVNINNAAANTMTFTGTTNTIDLNGSGATAITLGGTTSTITLSGSGTKKVTGLDSPSASTDATNKAYVDSVAAGLDPKESVRLATTAVLSNTFIANNGTPATGQKTYNTTNKTITWFAGEGPTSIDGTSLANGNNILVKDETATSGPSAGEGRQYNGIYTRTSQDVWTRRSDMDGTPSNEISTGNFTFVTAGTANGGKGFVLSATDAADPDNINVNTETKVFTQFSSAGSGVTSVSTESGTATPSGGSLTITGSPSIDTSGSGSTITVALAADLDTGATGFTVTNRRMPFATAANTLGDSGNILFDNGTFKNLNIGDGVTYSGVVLGATTDGYVTTQGTNVNEYINGAALATNTNSGNMSMVSGRTSGTGISGNLGLQSGNATGSGNSGTAAIKSGDANSGNSGNIIIESGSSTSGDSGSINLTVGTAGSTQGLITFYANNDDVQLTNSPNTDKETGGTSRPAVTDVNFIREKVVRRKTGTTSVVLTAGTASAAKFLVYVQESATIKYASEVLVTSTNATTGVDSTEYAIIGTGTTPAGLTITPAAASAVVQLTVSQTNAGTIVVEAIPLV